MVKKVITSESEVFDVESFNKIKLALSGQNSIAVSEKSKNVIFRKELIKNGSTYILNESGADKNLIKHTLKNDQLTIESETLDDYFSYGKQYYTNGNIKSKGINSWLGLSVGEVYFYDLEGKLVKTDDTDVGYGFNFEKVVEFCNNQGIDLSKKHEGGQRIFIKKGIFPTDNKPSWYISSPNFKDSEYELIILDGMTGQIKEKRNFSFPKDGF